MVHLATLAFASLNMEAPPGYTETTDQTTLSLPYCTVISLCGHTVNTQQQRLFNMFDRRQIFHHNQTQILVSSFIKSFLGLVKPPIVSMLLTCQPLKSPREKT